MFLGIAHAGRERPPEPYIKKHNKGVVLLAMTSITYSALFRQLMDSLAPTEFRFQLIDYNQDGKSSMFADPLGRKSLMAPNDAVIARPAEGIGTTMSQQHASAHSYPVYFEWSAYSNGVKLYANTTYYTHCSIDAWK